MLVEAKIEPRHYIPEKIVPGMLFQARPASIQHFDTFQVFELTPEIYKKEYKGYDAWIVEHGHPFNLVVTMDLDQNPDKPRTDMATMFQVFQDEKLVSLPQVKYVSYRNELYDLELGDVNYSFRQDGWMIAIFTQDDDYANLDSYEGYAVIAPYGDLFDDDEEEDNDEYYEYDDEF